MMSFKGFTRTLNLYLCLEIQGRMRETHWSFCLRVIMNEKPLNLEKTTSSVSFVIVN